MQNPYRIVCQCDPSDRSVTLLFDGKFSEDAIPELERLLDDARGTAHEVVLDLSEVTLVDRKAVQYLVHQASHDVKLVNCPNYLRSWISQEDHTHDS